MGIIRVSVSGGPGPLLMRPAADGKNMRKQCGSEEVP